MKISRKSFIKKLDKTVSLKVRERDLNCVLCGKSSNLQAGHLFSRVNYSTRWDLNNIFAQCSGCNLKHEHDPWVFYRWYITKFGQDKFDALYLKHKQVTHYKSKDLEEILEGLSK